MKYYGYLKVKTKENIEARKKDISNHINDENIEIEFLNSLENLENNSILYLDSLCSLGNTVYQILIIFFELKNKQINIVTIKDKFHDTTLDFLTYEVLIELLNFEKKNIENRLLKTKKTLIKKEKTVGRKKGKKTKSIFDKYKRIILKKLIKGISQVEILKELKSKDSELKNITIQALGRYIKKQKELEKLKKEKKIDPYLNIRSKFN